MDDSIKNASNNVTTPNDEKDTKKIDGGYKETSDNASDNASNNASNNASDNISEEVKEDPALKLNIETEIGNKNITNTKSIDTSSKSGLEQGKLLFNNEDSILDMGTNEKKTINAPKDINRLEEIGQPTVIRRYTV